jgi:hypothetical protein
MARILSTILFVLVLGGIGIYAQSDSMLELKRQVNEGNSKAILEVISEPAKIQDPKLKQYLKNIASDEKKRVLSGSPSYFAHIALAKLGEQEAISEIISEADSDTPTYVIGMKKLFLTGGKPALRKFYQLLDDDTQIDLKEDCEGKSGFCNDVFYYPKNAMAIFYLSQMVDNPPTRRGVPSNKVSLWKEWFITHKYLIE